METIFMNTKNCKTNEPHKFRLTLADKFNLKDLVNNNYRQASKVLFTLVPNEKFGQLITIAPHSLTMLNTKYTEFSSIEVWFTGQNGKQLEIEDNANMTLIIG